MIILVIVYLDIISTSNRITFAVIVTIQDMANTTREQSNMKSLMVGDPRMVEMEE